MIKNIILLTIILGSKLFTADLIYPNGKIETFQVQKSSRSFSNSSKIYTKNSQIYRETGSLFISFGSIVDISYFEEKYKIKLIKLTNKYFYTALFKIDNKQDIITLCSEINKNEKIRYAKPNWKRERLLR